MKRWLIIIVIALLIYVGWKYFYGSETAPDAAYASDDPTLILDRVWVDSKPDRYTDYLQAFVIISDVPFGAFQKASAYHGEFELFEYTREDNRVQALFPQTSTKKRFKYKISRCDDLPPYDLCLHLSKNPWNGPRKYYSFSDGEGIGGQLADLPDRVRAAAVSK